MGTNRDYPLFWELVESGKIKAGTPLAFNCGGDLPLTLCVVAENPEVYFNINSEKYKIAENQPNLLIEDNSVPFFPSKIILPVSADGLMLLSNSYSITRARLGADYLREWCHGDNFYVGEEGIASVLEELSQHNSGAKNYLEALNNGALIFSDSGLLDKIKTGLFKWPLPRFKDTWYPAGTPFSLRDFEEGLRICVEDL